MRRDGTGDEGTGAPIEWTRCNDATLVAGMRRGWEPAYAEFFDRFSPMLTALARRERVPAPEQRTVVTEFLGDIALRLGRQTALPVPSALAAYVAASFRRRMAMDARREQRAGMRQESLYGHIGNGTERVVAELSSAYAIDAARGEQLEDPARHPERRAALRGALVASLLGALTDGERRVIGYLAERVPQREIARMVGVTPGAMRVRISRLRERLRRVAVAHVNELPADEGVALARVIRRAQDGPADRERGP